MVLSPFPLGYIGERASVRTSLGGEEKRGEELGAGRSYSNEESFQPLMVVSGSH